MSRMCYRDDQGIMDKLAEDKKVLRQALDWTIPEMQRALIVVRAQGPNLDVASALVRATEDARQALKETE